MHTTDLSVSKLSQAQQSPSSSNHLNNDSLYRGSWHAFTFTFPIPVEEVRIGLAPYDSTSNVFGGAEQHALNRTGSFSDSNQSSPQQHTVQLYIRTEGDAVASCDYRLTRASPSAHINAADAGPRSGTNLAMPFTAAYGDRAMRDMDKEIRNYSMNVKSKSNPSVFNSMVTDFVNPNNGNCTAFTKACDPSLNLSLVTPSDYLDSLNKGSCAATDWLKTLTTTFPNNNMSAGDNSSSSNLLHFPVPTQHLINSTRAPNSTQQQQQPTYAQQLLGNMDTNGNGNILNAFSRPSHSQSTSSAPSYTQQSQGATSGSSPKSKRPRRSNATNMIHVAPLPPSNMPRMYSSGSSSSGHVGSGMATMLTAMNCGSAPSMVSQHQMMMPNMQMHHLQQAQQHQQQPVQQQQQQQQQNSQQQSRNSSDNTNTLYSRSGNGSDFVCNICSMQFNRLSNLQRHVVLIHSRDMSVSLDLSSASSSSSTNTVVRPGAPQTQQSQTATGSAFFPLHQQSSPHTEGPSRRVMASKVCPVCRVMRCRQYKQLIEHVQRQHNIALHIDALDFDTMVEFLSWKQQLEASSGASFAQKCGMSEVKDSINTYFACNRTGKFQSKSMHHSPSASSSLDGDSVSVVGSSAGGGSIRIGATCTAFIRTARCKTTGRIKATFCATHLGH